MKIGIANDHRGVKVKRKIEKYLHDNGYTCVNYGTDTEELVDYVDYAVKLCKDILDKKIDLGILVCGTGIGMSIAANKIKGIICGRVVNPREAGLIKEHNMANVMSIGQDIENVEEVVEAFLKTENSTVDRYIRRTNKIKQLEGGLNE